MRWVALVAWVAVLPGCMHHADGPDEVVVFAAASLTDALETMTESFHALHPSRRLVLNTGATSILARQIAQGAPADVLLSANEAWMYYLAACERLDGVARPLAGNRLVVAGPGEVRPLADPAGMLRLNSIALADPSHVPAGQYAREALECAGLWDAVAPRIIPLLDVRMALIAVKNGAAEAAIVYASDVRATSGLHVLLEWPDSCTPEIRYMAGRIRDAPNPVGAEAFLTFVTDAARMPLWKRFGFVALDP